MIVKCKKCGPLPIPLAQFGNNPELVKLVQKQLKNAACQRCGGKIIIEEEKKPEVSN